jgi:uncharacterized protein
MEFTNTFHVPVDIETTFTTLIDLEKVTPCLPGATLEEVDGDTYTGRCKVKVGPIAVTYRGTATMAEVDHEKKTARIEAKGKETRGAGTANADVVATLTEVEGGTDVTVVTDLNITGKPAQFGRGVMADVGNKIIDTFAERLQVMVTAGEEEPAPAAVAADGPGPEAVMTGAAAAADDKTSDALAEPVDEATPSGPRKVAFDPERENEALDMVAMGGSAVAKRVVPLVAVLAVIAGLVWWLRQR